MQPTRNTALLVADDVHRHFEGMHAVDGVSIEVATGKITGLIGPNGAGKSTFLAVLAGTLPASEGTIVFDGQDITRMPAYARARRGLSFVRESVHGQKRRGTRNVSQVIRSVMQAVSHFGPQEWLFSLLGVVAIGAFCMRGFGSRKNY